MFVKIAAGIEHALALTADFRVRAWGGNRAGECQVPADLPPAAGIAAGGVYSLALLKDGSLRMWGEERCRLPPGLPKLKAVWASYDMVGGLTLDGKALLFSVDPRLQNRLALPAGLFPVWQPSK
jgi:alpha-tubulin suppressor-like RCC1 family protein